MLATLRNIVKRKPIDVASRTISKFPRESRDAGAPQRGGRLSEWESRLLTRVAVLESVLGECDGTVLHPPRHHFYDGFADVLRFYGYVGGVAYATCDLVGGPEGGRFHFGHNELMICTRGECEWAPQTLSRIARYARRNPLAAGELMELDPADLPYGSQLRGMLFCHPEIEDPALERFGGPANVLLCVGLTESEFDRCRRQGTAVMPRALREAGVFPFTDHGRDAIV